MVDNVVAVLALRARDLGRFSQSALDTSKWSQLVGSLWDENWLSTYECARRGWLPVAGAKTDQHFSGALADGVTFLDDSVVSTPLSVGAAAAAPGGTLDRDYT